MVSNPGYYSQMATAGSLTQIEDGVDNPHTGLIKALSLGVAGNYVISGFDASSVTATSATIAAGVVLRDGKRVAISGSGVSLSATYTTGYHLLVARSSALAVINPAAANKVPAFTAGDVPIAILAHTGSNPMQIQYFGTGKKENSLSVAYDNSGYTEAGALTGDANGITMTGLYKLDTLPTATVATDDKVIVQDTNDSDKVKTVTAQSIADLSAYSDASAIAAVEGEATLALSGDVTIASGKDLTVDGTTLHVDGANNRVGIGTASPDTALHVEGSGHIIRVKDTSAGDSALTRTMGGVELSAAGMNTSSKFGVPIKFMSTDSAFTTENPKFLAAIVPVARESYTADTKGGMAIGFATTANTAGASTVPQVNMTLDHNGRLGIGTETPTNHLDVRGDVSGDRFLVESIQYELALVTSAGATPGPPSNNFNFADTDTIYRVSTVTGTPPGSAQLDGALPATSGNEGLVFKFIVTAIASGEALTITANGSDTIVDQTLSVLAGAGGTYSIPATGVYELVCFSGSWMLYKTV